MNKQKLLVLGVLSLSLSLATAPATAAEPTGLHPRFERALEGELEIRERIREGILHIQADNARLDGKRKRGTHAKGACSLAKLEIFDLAKDTQSIPAPVRAQLRKGVFAKPGTYPSYVRFANAESKILPDQIPDVRSMSVAARMPEGRFDLSMNDSPTFPINDAHVFASLMTLVQYGPVGAWNRLSFSEMASVAGAIALGTAQKFPAVASYTKLRYWSGVPFLLGDDAAVKYSLRPCANNAAEPLTLDPDTLSQELARHLASEEAPACFTLEVQMLDAGKMVDPFGDKHDEKSWVENAAIEWPESEAAPFYPVGKLTLAAGTMLASETCELPSINVNANSFPAHRPLGSINRARYGAEKASAEARGAE